MKNLRSALIVLAVLTFVRCGNSQVENEKNQVGDDNDLIRTHVMVAMNDDEGGEWIDTEMVPVEVTSPDENPYERVETIVHEGSYGEGVHFAASTNNKLEDKYLKIFNESKTDSVYLYVLFTNAGLGKSDSEIQLGIDRETAGLLNLDNYYKSAVFYKVMSKNDVFSELGIDEVQESNIQSTALHDKSQSIHSSIQDYLENVLIGESNKFKIRIDQLEDYSYRFSKWSGNKQYKDKPDLIILNGIYDGGSEAVTYIFKDGHWKYFVYQDYYCPDCGLLFYIENEGLETSRDTLIIKN